MWMMQKKAKQRESPSKKVQVIKHRCEWGSLDLYLLNKKDHSSLIKSANMTYTVFQ